MSWDVKVMGLLVIIWAAVTVIFLTLMDMPAGTRAWATGSVVMLVVTLGVWYAERKGAQRLDEDKPAGDDVEQEA